ncbi:hypothetical protein Tco_0138872 [Tanacetum coccineum]
MKYVVTTQLKETLQWLIQIVVGEMPVAVPPQASSLDGGVRVSLPITHGNRSGPLRTVRSKPCFIDQREVGVNMVLRLKEQLSEAEKQMNRQVERSDGISSTRNFFGDLDGRIEGHGIS